MSEAFDALLARVEELEKHAQRRGQVEDYAARAQMEDRRLSSRMDRNGRYWESSVLDLSLTRIEADALYDAAGAAAARAPADAEYLVAATSSGLSAERVPTGTASITWDFGTAAQAKANVVFGTTSGTVCQGNDARLSDARAPTAHKTSHQDAGSDELDLTGMSGLLGTAQTPTTHGSTTHKQGQADAIFTPDAGWISGTHSSLKNLANGASLSDTQDYLLTLAAALIAEKQITA